VPHALLEILKYFLLAMIWLFFVYAIRMVYVEVRRSRAERPETVQAPPVAADRSIHLRLRVLDPPQRRGRTFDLGDEVTLGRAAGCAVSLEDDTFTSGVHARVFEQNGDLWLEDLGSTNGTFVNNERLERPARLQRGDRVKVGTTVFEVAR
jgi:pSer/pThr/pTyr-binding forkhead associated (FHA) protein